MIGTVEEAREEAARIGRLEARLTGRQATVDLLRALLLLLLAGASLFFFVLSRHWYWLFSLLVMGPVALLWAWNSLYQYFGKRPTLLLDAEGLHHVLLGSIPWRDVVGVSLFSVAHRNGSFPMFGFGLAPGVRMQGPAPWSLAWGSQRCFALTGLSEPPAQILAMAEVLRDRVSPPRLQSWYHGISEERLASFQQNERLLAGFERLAAKGTRPDAGMEAELQRLTGELDANTAELRAIHDAEARGFALSARLVLVGLALGLLLVAGVLWTVVR